MFFPHIIPRIFQSRSLLAVPTMLDRCYSIVELVARWVVDLPPFSHNVFAMQFLDI